MTARLYVDANYLRNEIARLMEQYPDLAEDETLRADMLAGETEIEAVIAKAVDERREAETMASALKERIGTMRERLGRHERKADAMKKLIRGVMQTANLDRVKLPEATISLSAPSYSVSVTDMDAIPQGYYRTRKEADKTAIKKAWEAGDEIPGTALVLGDDTLTIRVK